MDEATRKRTNTERLLLIDQSIRRQIGEVIAKLEMQGERPLIAKDVYRRPERQLELLKRGVTKLAWGYHNATGPNGEAQSLAADIVDAELAWNAPRTFWLKLGRAALGSDLGWGGYFGLSAGQQSILGSAIENPATRLQKFALGWDPAHVETRRVKVSEAQAGER